MPKVSTTPKNLKPFLFHGVDLGEPDGDHAHGTCPLCGREEKFFVNAETGLWDCKRCGVSGNPTTFLRQLYDACRSPSTDYKRLAQDRRVSEATLAAWGVVKSHLTGDWVVPGYATSGEIGNLYRYVRDFKTKRMCLLSTPETGHQLFGLPTFDVGAETIYLCEGPWDAMALWEALGSLKRTDDGYSSTGNVGVSLRVNAAVLATPGCNVYFDHWSSLLAGKRVVICFDSDHPLERNGKVAPPAGHAGARRVAETLINSSEPPASVSILSWGEGGYDPARKHGYDVRDLLTSGDRAEGVEEFLTRIQPIPEEWRTEQVKKASGGGARIDMIECHSWKELTNQWRKAMQWPDSGTGLDYALSVMLASAMSTQMIGDQLWVRVVSPPSTGKTQLCDGLGVNHQQVRSVGNFTGLHSGFQTDGEAKEDHSLLSALKDKTLVIKDADTLMKNPAREKIVGQLRDAYDMNCAVAYGNRVKREYMNHRFTVIMAGTEAMLEMDTADLGARFLDVVVMDQINADLEADVNRRGFFRILNNRGTSANGVASTQDDGNMIKAKAMTGGYLSWLRSRAERLLAEVNVGEDADKIQERISTLAQFVAFARARPSKTQDEAVTREMSARLNAQLTKLAICLAVVLNRKTIDDEVMRRVTRVARDTARGKVLDIFRRLLPTGRLGVESQAISNLIHHGYQKTQSLLRFLRAIGGAEWFNPVSEDGKVLSRVRWRLTPRMEEIVKTADS